MHTSMFRAALVVLSLGLFAVTPEAAAAPPVGTAPCASENQTCSFSGTATVYYGSGSTWVNKTATGSIGCNNGVFGDPLPGVVKMCAYQVAPNNPPTGTAFCAGEGETCNFSGTRDVYYGAINSWVKLTATNSQSCNNTVYGDPIGGVYKGCYIGPAAAAAPASNPKGPSGTRYCATETQTCNFIGTRTVYYGAGSTWVSKTATNSIDCHNSVFGDPLPGVKKSCYVRPPIAPQSR